MKVEIATQDDSKVVALFKVLDTRHDIAEIRFKDGKYPSVTFLPNFDLTKDSTLIYIDAGIELSPDGVSVYGEMVLFWDAFDDSVKQQITGLTVKFDSSLMIYMHDEPVERLRNIRDMLGD